MTEYYLKTQTLTYNLYQWYIWSDIAQSLFQTFNIAQ